MGLGSVLVQVFFNGTCTLLIIMPTFIVETTIHEHVGSRRFLLMSDLDTL